MTEAPTWCCLCGQRHATGTPCDPRLIMQLRRQADLVRRLAVISRNRKPSTPRDELT